MKNKGSPFVELWYNFSKERKVQFFKLSGMVLLASIAEVISIGAVLPFLAVILDRDTNRMLSDYPLFEALYQTIEKQNIIIVATAMFCIAAIITAAMRLVTLWYMTKVSFETGSDISYDIYERTLYQPYAIHCRRNSSDIINAVAVKTSTIIYNIIFPALTIFSSVIILIFITITLSVINVEATLATFIGFGVVYIIIAKFLRNQMNRDSRLMADESTKIIKILQEGLGGIREVLLDGHQREYCQIYKDANKKLRAVQARNLFVGGSPRYIVESIGIVILCLLALKATIEKMEISVLLPLIGCLALASQRMLPLIQQTFSSWVAIKASKESLIDVLEILGQNSNKARDDNITAINFEDRITLKNVSFQYDENTKKIIKDVNFDIVKGERVGIIGESGVGKSTLMDLMMGLHLPTSGIITVDNVTIAGENASSWQKRVAHVPQNVYINDASIAANIAIQYTEEGIDIERVVIAAEKAQLKSFIESLEDGYHSNVGERGSLLSGGQRQRIGIARALFKGADVLFLDEATNALDSKVEEQVLKEIMALSKEYTIIIITHKEHTLRYCDKIIEMTKDNQVIVKNRN